jgi:glycosyltransferase involved in cell wall biosynthesis
LILYSQETAAFYIEKFAYRGPIGVSPNTQSDLALRARLAESADTASALISKHDLKGRKVLLSVGRLTRVKRYDRLIRAFSNLRDAMKDVVLVLIGDGEERDYLEGLVEELGIRDQVLFGGHLEGNVLFAWYALASCFALTSESETWGAVINEALVAGVPVICSDRAGASELIVNPSVGAVVDASNEVALTNCLIQRLANARPVTEETPQTLRDSLMPQTFEECVDGFMDPICDLV